VKRSVTTLLLTSACAVDGPVMTTDKSTYALPADVGLALVSGSTTVLANLCGERLDQQQTDGSWQAAVVQPPLANGATACPADAVSLGPLGHLDDTRHLDATFAPGTYRFVTNVEDDTTDPPSHPDVDSNSFQLTR